MTIADRLAHDGLFWRRLAHLGASRGPEWLRRYAPPVFGCAAALLVPRARRAVLANLRRMRGRGTFLRDGIEVAQTFSEYAHCLTEVLSGSHRSAHPPIARFEGSEHLDAALSDKRGAIFVTAHTGGWELVGPMFSRDRDLPLLMVMERERDARARELQDRARTDSDTRIAIAHAAADDPLGALPLLHHVRAGGVVAIQIDRAPRGMKTRSVRIFGQIGTIPEGPLRLAQLSGAPIVPVFAVRTHYRRYLIQTFQSVRVSRRASDAELDRAAQSVADSMTTFLRAHRTKWFHFAEH